MSESTTTSSIRTNRLNRTTRLTAARRAGLFLVGTAGALTLTGGLAGNVSALTPPAPMPILPIAVAPASPQPPVGPMILGLPDDPGPVVGPDDLVQPLPTPDPDPTPQGPDDFTNGEPGPVDPDLGPDDFTNGDPGPVDPDLGPDDFTNGDPGPVDPDPGPDDFTNGEPGPVDPDLEPEPEVLDETATDAGEVDDAAASSLAFTGGDIGALTAGLALLGVGGATAAGGVIARRRRQAQA